MSGWPGILSAGVVVVRMEGGIPMYLLMRCFNYWDFPKGEVESGEEPLATAIREVGEETTIDDLDFCWGESYTETPPYGPKRKVARYYIAETAFTEIAMPINPELGLPEHDEYRWLDFDSAMGLLVPRVRKVLGWAQDRIVNSPSESKG